MSEAATQVLRLEFEYSESQGLYNSLNIIFIVYGQFGLLDSEDLVKLIEIASGRGKNLS